MRAFRRGARERFRVTVLELIIVALAAGSLPILAGRAEHEPHDPVVFYRHRKSTIQIGPSVRSLVLMMVSVCGSLVGLYLSGVDVARRHRRLAFLISGTLGAWLLCCLLVVVCGDVKEDSRASFLVGELRQIVSAQEVYRTCNGTYAPSLGALVNPTLPPGLLAAEGEVGQAQPEYGYVLKVVGAGIGGKFGESQEYMVIACPVPYNDGDITILIDWTGRVYLRDLATGTHEYFTKMDRFPLVEDWVLFDCPATICADSVGRGQATKEKDLHRK